MTWEAFFRQGFIPFEDAVERQADVLAEAAPRIADRVSAAVHDVPRPTRPAFLGIGASVAALGAPVAFLRARGIPASLLNAAEFEEQALEGSDVLVALSQSGRSRETVAAVRATTAPTLAIVNVSGSPLTEVADTVVGLGDLPDSLASTIGFVASAMAAGMLAEAWTTGIAEEDWASLGARTDEFVRGSAATIDRLVDVAAQAALVEVTGPYRQGGALDAAALLLREVSRLPSAAYETRAYLHGLMEATRPSTLHLVLDGPDSSYIVPALAELGRTVVTIGGDRIDGASLHVGIPTRSDLEVPAFTAALMQRLALGVARRVDVDPDEFRFLGTNTKLEDADPSGAAAAEVPS